MSSNRVAKRKAEEAVPEVDQEDAKKRAKKDEGSDHEGEVGAAVAGSDEEEDVDEDELAALDTSNVIEGGRRTRGVRIDYSKLKDDENEEDEDEEDEEQGDENDEEAALKTKEVADETADKAEEGSVHEEEDTGVNGASKEKNGDEESEE